MNNYFKIFLTVIIIAVSGILITLSYELISMADDMLNIAGLLGITATALGAFWGFHQIWVKPIPKDEEISFGEKRKEGNSENKNQ